MRQPVERIQQILTVTDPDGSARFMEGTTLVPSTDTPEFGVKERLVSVPGTGPRQTVTTFAPAMTRPRTYPGELPFVADATIYATEHPGGDQPPSARYLIERDPETVIEIVMRQSIDTGWRIIADAPSLPLANLSEEFVLEWNGRVRMVYVAHRDGQTAIVELDDVSKWW